MPEMTIQTTPPVDPAERSLQITADRERLSQLTELVKTAESEMSDIKARLRDMLGTGDHKATFGLTISDTMRFNDDQCRKVLGTLPNGADLIRSISETTINRKLAEKTLPPAVYDLCKVIAGKPTVKL